MTNYKKYPDSRDSRSVSVFYPSFLTSVLAVGLLLSVSAGGAEVEWLPASGSNDYNSGSNWAGGIIPGSADIAVFPDSASGDQTVNLNLSPTQQPSAIEIGTTSGTLTLNSTGNGPGTVLLQMSNTSTFGTGSGANIIIQKTGAANFTVRGVGAVVIGGAGASNNTLTVQGSGVMFGSQYGTVHVGFEGSDDNLLHIKDGATLATRSGTIGRTNASNNTVRLSGAGTTWSIPNSDTLSVSLGVVAGSNNNNLIVEHGAEFNSGANLRVFRGSVIIDGGTVNLNAGATHRDFLMAAAAGLQGQGTLQAANLISSASGAFVNVGTEGNFGVLNTEFTGDGWNNNNVQIQMGIGDVSITPVAGTNHDFLNIDGSFIFGGELVIDLSQAVIASGMDLKLISWSQTVGTSEDLSVSFINGDSLGYYVTGDGLYVIPEPSYMALGVIVLCGVFIFRLVRLRQTR